LKDKNNFKKSIKLIDLNKNKYNCKYKMVIIFNDNPSIHTPYEDLKSYYDNVLNKDKTTYKSSNDEPTPISCIEEMIEKLPLDLWNKEDLTILDPCCGNGNFFIPIMKKLRDEFHDSLILKEILHFNDINEDRLNNVKEVFIGAKNITKLDFLNSTFNKTKKFDLIVANPPYAKLLEDGKRASKNHNLIKDFISKALSLLKEDGYILFITPDNWMSYADRNTLIEELTSLQIIHLDIHSAKKHFKKIGSSFTWYVVQNKKAYKDIQISGIWKGKQYTSSVKSQIRKYIPLYYTEIIQSILSKTVDNSSLKKFEIKTSSNLHKFTKKEFISDTQDEVYKYKLIHTPKQTVYSSKPHIYQDGYKVFISTTDTYNVFIDKCGMTQSIVFILCKDLEEAERYKKVLLHPLYIFINNICRWGNFNNIRILQSFPIPEGDPYKYFNITKDEITFIEN
jgi:methylase of polypeptide subunit release factors